MSFHSGWKLAPRGQMTTLQARPPEVRSFSEGSGFMCHGPLGTISSQETASHLVLLSGTMGTSHLEGRNGIRVGMSLRP